SVIERRNHTFVEAARTMLIFSKSLLFQWAEVVATAYYTQSRSLIHTQYNKTPYELLRNRNLDLKFFRVFGALCYPTNDEDLGKLKPKADIGIFIAPISSPPVLLPSTGRREDRPEVCLPPRKRLCSTQGPRYEVGESSFAVAARPTGGCRADYGFADTMDTEIRRQRAEEVGYGIRDVWVDPREAIKEVAPITLKGVNTRVTELAAVQEQDTEDIYAVIEDTQDRQTQIYQRVETLVDDSQYHYETARLLEHVHPLG
ncbi:hypothetical protein Tco_0871041, partial [Tanacetum coccineum]